MGEVMHIVPHVLATSFGSWKPKYGSVHGFVKRENKVLRHILTTLYRVPN
jgi:hypothetical protein